MWTLLVALLLLAMVIYDLLQREHAIPRNFPIIGHFRYWFEAVGPELRQYIVTSNNEEKPSAGTSGAGSMPPRRNKTTISGSEPTTIWKRRRTT